ncbi:hypothetical protein BDF19DRAFT_416416 [Syncephalis fuscata]|nr:hypothetical protein BDF19DRAFT_416416 [Syncephalis fuscata]
MEKQNALKFMSQEPFTNELLYASQAAADNSQLNKTVTRLPTSRDQPSGRNKPAQSDATELKDDQTRVASMPHDSTWEDSLSMDLMFSKSMLGNGQSRPFYTNDHIDDDYNPDDMLKVSLTDEMEETSFLSSRSLAWPEDTQNDARSILGSAYLNNNRRFLTNPLNNETQNSQLFSPSSRWVKRKKDENLRNVERSFQNLPPQSPFNPRQSSSFFAEFRDQDPLAYDSELERLLNESFFGLNDIPNNESLVNTPKSTVKDKQTNQKTIIPQHLFDQSTILADSPCQNDTFLSTDTTQSRKRSRKQVSFADNETIIVNNNNTDINSNNNNVDTNNNNDDNDSDQEISHRRKRTRSSADQQPMLSLLSDSDDENVPLELNAPEPKFKERSFILGHCDSTPEQNVDSTTEPIGLADRQKLAVLRLIKQLRDEAKVTGQKAMKALEACSGNVSLARRYLRLGKQNCIDFVWTSKEDSIILSYINSSNDNDNEDAIRELEKRRGVDAVQERQVFLRNYIKTSP